jgi:hypothetical protein
VAGDQETSSTRNSCRARSCDFAMVFVDLFLIQQPVHAGNIYPYLIHTGNPGPRTRHQAFFLSPCHNPNRKPDRMSSRKDKGESAISDPTDPHLIDAAECFDVCGPPIIPQFSWRAVAGPLLPLVLAPFSGRLDYWRPSYAAIQHARKLQHEIRSRCCQWRWPWRFATRQALHRSSCAVPVTRPWELPERPLGPHHSLTDALLKRLYLIDIFRRAAQFHLLLRSTR